MSRCNVAAVVYGARYGVPTGTFGTYYIVFLPVFVGHILQCIGWYLWDTLCSVSIGIFGTHYIVFLLVFMGYTMQCLYWYFGGSLCVVFLLVFVGRTIYCFYWYFWDMLSGVCVGICGAHCILFLLVFLGHAMWCFCWYLWGILYIVSFGIFGTHYVAFLLVFVGTLYNNSACGILMCTSVMFSARSVCFSVCESLYITVLLVLCGALGAMFHNLRTVLYSVRTATVLMRHSCDLSFLFLDLKCSHQRVIEAGSLELI